MKIHTLPKIHLALLPDAIDLNKKLLCSFGDLYNHPSTKRSHFFNGRFENIYIQQTYIPEISPLLVAVTQAAQEILQITESLQCGFWFNLMRPGDQTSLHDHEENEELLSAVYYVSIAEQCGDLILGVPPLAVRIQPVVGMVAFFPPSLPHAVEVNTSGQNRLSIAFNFGMASN